MSLFIAGGLELDNLWRSLLVKTILWFCEFIWILIFTYLYHCTSKHLAKNVITFETTEICKNHICLCVYMFTQHGHPHPAGSGRVWLQAGPCAAFQAMLQPFIWLPFGAFQKNHENKNKYQRVEHDMKAVRLLEVLRIDLNWSCGTAAKRGWVWDDELSPKYICHVNT